MRNDALKFKKLKDDLYNQKRKCAGKKNFVIRKLNEEELEYVQRFCVVEPYMYKIWKSFRPGFNINKAASIVKKIYYAKQNPVFLVMSKKEVETCKNVGLKPSAHKYKIYLNTLR